MATTYRSDVILPDILAEEVMKGFTGKLLLNGTDAVVMNPGLQAGRQEVGNTVTIPYFEDIGEAEQVPENGAGSLDNLTQSSETATVVRFFKGVSMTMLAQIAKNQGRDLMDVAVEKLRLAFVRGLDTLCLSRALSRAASASMEHDGTAANVSTTSIVETLKLFGEDLDDDNALAIWGMNPKVYWDAATLADSTGRALFVPAQGERLARVGGVQVRMTAKTDMTVAGSPTTYKSPLIKRGAIAVWFNENVRFDIERDPTADVDMVMGNMYCVVHAYSTMPGSTHAGVAVMKTR
jgi:hypothetical protein